jgi:hypothetical protein
MRSFVSRGRAVAVFLAAVLATMLTAAGAQASAAPSATGDVGPFAWADCRSGNSCYFQNAEGGTPVWVAPSPGCFNLGEMNPPFNDRISSVWNRGGGLVNMYNWTGSSWQWVDDVPVGAAISYSGSDWRNDIIDLVCIDG